MGLVPIITFCASIGHNPSVKCTTSTNFESLAKGITTKLAYVAVIYIVFRV